MKKVKCQWHNFPVHGCNQTANHFFMSLLKPEPGLTPRHRAVCNGCYPKFFRSLLSGCIREISFEKWQKLTSEKRLKNDY